MRVKAFFQPGWADWEAGSVLAMLREDCGASVTIATPTGASETSIGGVRAASDGAFGDVTPADSEVFLVIGSAAWPAFRDETFFKLLREALSGGAIVGAICAGTVAAARAGLFAERPHTSNERTWLQAEAPGYAGAEHYVDTPRAVSAGRLVSAPGSAPGTFCSEILRLVAPARAAAIDETHAMMAREWLA